MKFEDVRKLHQKKFRDVFGHFLVEGEHPVLELQKAAARNPALRGSHLYVTNVHARWQSPFETHVISSRLMAQLSDTRTPQGIIALVPMWPASSAAEHERAVYLHQIQDPGNLGTILRTLAWFGDFRCLLSPDSVDPFNSKVVRASMGAIFHVPLELDVDWAALRERYARIACLQMQGGSVLEPAFQTFDCYVFGNEARGLPHQALADIGARPFTIAGRGPIESLNLATAVSLCAYELRRQHR